jgi:hypothetical protein
MTHTAIATQCLGAGSRLITNGRTSTRLSCATCHQYHAPASAFERAVQAALSKPENRGRVTLALNDSDSEAERAVRVGHASGATKAFLTPKPYQSPAQPLTPQEKFELSRPSAPPVVRRDATK